VIWIERFLCWLRSRHAYCRYSVPTTIWSCRCGKREQTDLEWIQEVMGS